MTWPLSASKRHDLSRPRMAGRAGLGMTVTSVLFLLALVVLVGHLTRARRAEIPANLLAT